MLPDLPDLGLLLITLLGAVGLGMLCLALMTAGGLMLVRSLAERLPVRPDGAPLPVRRTSARAAPDAVRQSPHRPPATGVPERSVTPGR